MSDSKQTDIITRDDLLSDLVASGLSRKDARTALDVLAASAADALANGLRVKLAGIGTLSPKHCPAKEGVMRGRAYSTPARVRAAFRPAPGLLRAMNGGGE